MRGVITFVFSNPGHHAEILLPVVRSLQAKGHHCQIVSLAEFRGLRTPDWSATGAAVVRALPFARPGRVPPPPADTGQAGARRFRSTLQQLVWRLGLGPRLRWLLRDSRLVVVPNDAAYPYGELTILCKAMGIPFVLVQEGIRFALPIEDKVAYGLGGAARVCVWGAGSADYFESRGVPRSAIVITGNPRYDAVDRAAWTQTGDAYLRANGILQVPLLYMSNPIDAQGFGTTAFKLELFRSFLRECGPALTARDVPIVVKLHSYENPATFRAIAAEVGAQVHVAEGVPLFALLASARAAVVAASTVGLEALYFGLPLAALQLGRHGFAFEYVSRGAAVPLRPGEMLAGLHHLLEAPSARAEDGRALLERHLAHIGRATDRVRDTLLSVRGPA